MENTDLLYEDYDVLFEEASVELLSEEMNPKKVRSILKKLKTGFPYKPLSQAKWSDAETIKAAGLDVQSMRTWYKNYMKAYNDFQVGIDPKNIATVKTEMYLNKAKAAKKELQKMDSKIKGFERQFVKGVAKAGTARIKADTAKVKSNRAEVDAKKKEKKMKEDAAKVASVKAAKVAQRKAFVGKVRKKVAKINFVTGK